MSAAGAPEVTLAGRDWRSLVDLGALGAFMDARGLERGPITEVAQLTGGTQNVLVRFWRGDRGFVLRRPPPSPFGDGDRTMAREAQVLGALGASDVPHPRLIAFCPDRTVLGAAFYLMEPVDGFVASAGLPALHAGSSTVRHGMGLSAAEAAAALARIDVEAAGLGKLGKVDGFTERQAPRWLSQLDRYAAAYPGWTGRSELPGVEAIARWLAANLPRRPAAGLMHGDFHLGNILFRPDGPAVAAVVDWELTTLGDPLMDLGVLLCTWADPDGRHPGCITVEPWSGFATEAELIERYAAASGRDVSDVNWYVVLACFKLAILQEGTYARAAAGQADMATGRWLHGTSIKLLERALGRI